jgi:hypothetical protein
MIDFSDRVRTVLKMAREEAVRLDHDYVGTEHILLGLIREGNGVGAAILSELNVELDELQAGVEKELRPGKSTHALGEFPYTSRAKKVLEFAMAEARELSHDSVQTDHLLLGLLREERGIAAVVLKSFGMTLERTREETLRLRSPAVPPLSGSTVPEKKVPAPAIPSPPQVAVSPIGSPQVQSGPNTAPADPAPDGTSEPIIFISYRRGDEAGYVTGHIYDRLVAEFGKFAVFKDFDSIPLGVDFKQHLDEAVAKSSIVLAVISPNWHERLHNARDFVRIELEAALRRSIPIIPLFVQRAAMPEEEQLPVSLHPLVYRNGAEIRPAPDFTNDMNRLISAIRRLIAR